MLHIIHINPYPELVDKFDVPVERKIHVSIIGIAQKIDCYRCISSSKSIYRFLKLNVYKMRHCVKHFSNICITPTKTNQMHVKKITNEFIQPWYYNCRNPFGEGFLCMQPHKCYNYVRKNIISPCTLLANKQQKLFPPQATKNIVCFRMETKT